MSPVADPHWLRVRGRTPSCTYGRAVRIVWDAAISAVQVDEPGRIDGGTIASDAGGLCFVRLICVVGCSKRSPAFLPVDRRTPGYEDLNDHDQLRYDPLIATLCRQPDERAKNRRRDADAGRGLAGKATLQRPESAPGAETQRGRYQSDPLRLLRALQQSAAGCLLRRVPVAGKLRTSDIDASLGSDTELERIVAQIRARWPNTRIRTRPQWVCWRLADGVRTGERESVVRGDLHATSRGAPCLRISVSGSLPACAVSHPSSCSVARTHSPKPDPSPDRHAVNVRARNVHNLP